MLLTFGRKKSINIYHFLFLISYFLFIICYYYFRRSGRSAGSRLPANVFEPLSEAKKLYIEGKYNEAIDKFSTGFL